VRDGDQPLTTVVIPVWGADYVTRYLPEALDSILRDATLRIVVVDNEAERPVTARPHVEVLRAPRRLTAGGARNLGLSAVRTDTVMFWDADDLLVDGSVAKLRRILERRPRAVAAVAAILERPGVPHHWPRAISRRLARRPRLLALANALTSQFPTTGAALLRTAAVRDAGGFADATGGEDWALGAALAFRGSVVHDAHPGRIYRRHGDSVSAQLRVFPDHMRHARVVRRRLRGDPRVPALMRAATRALGPLQFLVIAVIGPLARRLA
jgi:glycosyltransferase involved in cell wall biosynthesis